MELFDYQKEAVDFIEKNKKVYLAMGMGTGKTITALGAADKNAKKNILVVAEKNEIVNSQNFKKEVEAHFFNEDVNDYGLSYINLRESSIPGVQENVRYVCAINPDGLAKLDPEKILKSFDFVIVDEATLAKTATSQRSKRVRKICDMMDYVGLLSGTPMMNGAAELYNPLLLLGHPLAGDGSRKAREAFETIFAGGYRRKIRNTGKWFQDYVWWAKGANHVRELRYLVEDKFFFKRKEDTTIFKHRPERGIIEVPMTLPWLAEYQNAWNEYLVKANERDVDMDNVMELRNLIENGQVYQVNSRWKAYRVINDIFKGVYGKQRIIVFTMFIETYELIKKAMDVVGISFLTFDEVDEWKKGEGQVLLGRIKAHGKGGNLPEASVVLFVDMDFVPANNIQAENRIDRPEQKNPMTIRYYMTEGKDIVDAHVRRINQDKAKKIDEFMRPLTQEEIDEMPERLEELLVKFKKPFAILGSYPQKQLVKV